MKKLCALMALGAMFALVFACAVTASAADDVKTIRLASWGGAKHVDLATFVPLFTKEVETLSNGKIKVQYYPGGALGQDKDMPMALSTGTVDMAWITINGWSGFVPEVKIFDSPACGLTMAQLAKAIDMKGGLKDIIGKKFIAKGVKVLAWDDLGPGAIVSKEPIKVPTDIKGKKVRVYSEGGAAVIKACGGAPTKIAFSEVYLALQRGTVDAAHMGLQGVKSQKAFEVTKYCIIPSGFMGQPVMGYAMNLKLFNSFSPEMQKVIVTAARNAELKARKALVESRQNLIKEYEKLGMEVFVLAPDKPQWKAWVLALSGLIAQEQKQFSKRIISVIDKARK